VTLFHSAGKFEFEIKIENKVVEGELYPKQKSEETKTFKNV